MTIHLIMPSETDVVPKKGWDGMDWISELGYAKSTFGANKI